MKIKGSKFECEHFFYVCLKKHYCPKCGTKLLRKKVSEIINSESQEAQNYDFSLSEGYLIKGNVKFTHIEFYCNQCDKYYTVKEAKKNKF